MKSRLGSLRKKRPPLQLLSEISQASPDKLEVRAVSDNQFQIALKTPDSVLRAVHQIVSLLVTVEPCDEDTIMTAHILGVLQPASPRSRIAFLLAFCGAIALAIWLFNFHPVFPSIVALLIIAYVGIWMRQLSDAAKLSGLLLSQFPGQRVWNQ